MPIVNDRILSYQAGLHLEQDKVIPSFENEQRLYYRIKEGDSEALSSFRCMWKKKKLAPQRDGSLLGEQFGAISVITMVSRSVMTGGLDEGIGYDIDAFYTEKIKQTRSPEEVEEILAELVSYCVTLMQENKEKINEVYSARIVKCINYVHYHLHDKISLAVLAEKFEVSPSYLATQFKKETGMTLMDYVSEKKMESAKGMLRYSNLSIIEISDLFAYSSQSHFTKVFRETYHMTPKQYRDEFHAASEMMES